jgi:hypothetical protein
VPIDEARYQVAQIIAEGRERGFPTMMTVIAVGLFFDKHGIKPPRSLFEWLGTDFPTRRAVH